MPTFVVYGLIALAIYAAGTWTGIEWHAGQDAIAENARQVNARATERLRRQNADTAAVAYETDKAERQVEFITINEKVEHEVQTERVVYERTCIAPGGLQQLADAVRATADPGQPGSPMPAASAPR